MIGSPHIHVLGVDGCRTGWVVVTLDLAAPATATCAVMDTATLARAARRARLVGIDIPIGLLAGRDADGRPSRRDCDVLARRALGPRGSSVFPAPTREWLEFARGGSPHGAPVPAYSAVNDYARQQQGQGISKQAFFISPKVRVIDDVVRGDARLRKVVREVHPELSFLAMNAGRPLAAKKAAAGLDHRFALLARHLGEPVLRAAFDSPLPGATEDDVLDALAVAWTARRIVTGQAGALPEEMAMDAYGIAMQIWT